VKKFGVTREPMASSTDDGSLPWRVVRKAYRLTFLKLFTAAAALAGDGEMMYAVFAKGAASTGAAAHH